MKMRTRDGQKFDATLTTEHPPDIPGPLAIKRLDNGEYIAIKDVFSVESRLFDILEASDQERAQFEAADIMLVDPEVMDEAMKQRFRIEDLIPKVVQGYQSAGQLRPTLYAQIDTSTTVQAYPLLHFMGDGRMKAHVLFTEGRQAGQRNQQKQLLETCLVTEVTLTSPDGSHKIDGVMFASAGNGEPFQTVVRVYQTKRKKGKVSELKFLNESVDPDGLMGLAFIAGWHSRALSDEEARALQPRGMRAFLKIGDGK